MLVYGLIVALALVTTLLCASIYYNVKFGIRILNMQDFVTEALDILDNREESMAKILKIPLFHDSAEIRRVHSDIKASRDAILKIAESMVDTVSDNVPDSEDEDDNKPA